MDSNGDGDALNKHQDEQLKKFIAQMNVFSQHKKAMAENTRPNKRSKNKNKKRRL